MSTRQKTIMKLNLNAASLLLLTALCVQTSSTFGESRLASCKAPKLKYVETVTWGGFCNEPEGKGLAFGGQDRYAPDGRPHTRVRREGKWVSIHKELREKNTLQKLHKQAQQIRTRIKDLRARARYFYFEGLWSKTDKDLSGEMRRLTDDLSSLMKDLKGQANKASEYETGQVRFAEKFLIKAAGELALVLGKLSRGIDLEVIQTMRNAQIHVSRVSEALDAEPPARAVSPIVFDVKTGLYVLFGGDHFDYLRNDTWVFDPGVEKWMQRHPATAPAPRGNHKLVATGDGKVTLLDGYTYTSAAGYMAGQYGTVGGGAWTYDIAANAWTGKGEAHPPTTRVYRKDVFLPEYFLRGEKPDAKKHAARLKSLPVNKWVVLNPPHKPRLNRDWGTAAFDVDRDLILFWSGGHSAHGGTDVLHYHIATNRWELPFPIEFPLGQLYSGGQAYPAGFNFNLRPWMNGHTRRTYDYDQRLRKMIFIAPSGKDGNYYVYDPDIADWSGRAPRHKNMIYWNDYHSLFVCGTPNATFAWTGKAQLFSLDAKNMAWNPVKLRGKIGGPSVDNSILVYDLKRNRLLWTTGAGWRKPNTGQIYEIDCETWKTRALNPEGRQPMQRNITIREAVYHPQADLVIMALTEAKSTRTVAYDCANNRWVSLNLGGAPYAKNNLQIGMRYDSKRKLLWLVNAGCQVWVLRLNVKAADIIPLKVKQKGKGQT